MPETRQSSSTRENAKGDDREFRAACIAQDTYSLCIICHGRPSYYGSFTPAPWDAATWGLPPSTILSYGLCESCSNNPGFLETVEFRIKAELEQLHNRTFPVFLDHGNFVEVRKVRGRHIMACRN